MVEKKLTIKKPVKPVKPAKPIKPVKSVEVAKPTEPAKLVADDIIKEEDFIPKSTDPKKYFEAIGRRKTSSARVRLYTQGKKGIVVNNKDYKEYFATPVLQKIVEEPLVALNCAEKFGFTIIVNGGGSTGQAGACRHGITRALVLLNPYFKKRLKKSGFLTRDPRMRERKKPGLKRARKAPQWSKR